jgi:MFS family permease
LNFHKNIFYGWYVAFAAFLLGSLSYGFGVVSFGVFLGAMTTSLGWSSGLLSGIYVAGRLLGLLVNPIVGFTLDKHGPKKIIFLGVALVFLGSIFIFYTTNFWFFFIIYSLFISVGFICLGHTVSDSTVSKWFITKRNRAMAISTMGLSFGGIVIPIPVSLVIEQYGWQSGWLVVGVSVLILGSFAGFIMYKDPESIGLLPDGKNANSLKNTQDNTDISEEINFSLTDSAKHRAFWYISIGTTLAGTAINGVNIHLISYLYHFGLTLSQSAILLSSLYFISTIAKPMWAVINEKLPTRYCLSLCYLGGGIGLLLLLIANTVAGIILFAFVYGLTRGAQSFMSALIWPDYFGREHIGSIRGTVTSMGIIASAGGPLLAGVLFDVFGSYNIPFLVFVIFFFISSFFIFIAKKPTI